MDRENEQFLFELLQEQSKTLKEISLNLDCMKDRLDSLEEKVDFYQLEDKVENIGNTLSHIGSNVDEKYYYFKDTANSIEKGVQKIVSAIGDAKYTLWMLAILYIIFAYFEKH